MKAGGSLSWKIVTKGLVDDIFLFILWEEAENSMLPHAC